MRIPRPLLFLLVQGCGLAQVLDPPSPTGPPISPGVEIEGALFSGTASLSGHCTPMDSTQMDIRGDLGIRSHSSTSGFSADLRQDHYRITASFFRTDFAETHLLPRELKVDRVTYPASTPVHVQMRCTTAELTGTYAFSKGPRGWLGLDLGLQAFDLQLDTSGRGYLQLDTPWVPWISGRSTYHERQGLGPEAGLSGEWLGAGGRLRVSGAARMGGWSERRTGLLAFRARYELLPHLGVHLLFQKRTARDEPSKVPSEELRFNVSNQIMALGAGVHW